MGAGNAWRDAKTSQVFRINNHHAIPFCVASKQ